MKGISLEFKTKVQTETDELNNPVYSLVGITVTNCLIAPLSAPTSAREEQAIDQMRDLVTIHLPKTFTDDISGAYVAWGGKIFQLDSSSIPFMNENTPTDWNRYFTAESVADFDENDPDIWLHFFITEDSQYVLAQEGS